MSNPYQAPQGVQPSDQKAEVRCVAVRPVTRFCEAKALLKDQFLLFVLIGFVTLLISSMVPIVLVGPMMCGLFYCFIQKEQGQVSFEMLFKEFDLCCRGLGGHPDHDGGGHRHRDPVWHPVIGHDVGRHRCKRWRISSPLVGMDASVLLGLVHADFGDPNSVRVCVSLDGRPSTESSRQSNSVNAGPRQISWGFLACICCTRCSAWAPPVCAMFRSSCCCRFASVPLSWFTARSSRWRRGLLHRSKRSDRTQVG